ncbi:hypothetical protein [Stutzerimonas stutzeri]|uniref:hypothetical protein n=1 Tax=Stutzerimonas stutzeri TaxID=316 RepID=UPI001269805F|nr:hypothetical protein [Stutzerimonas stutzeri]
MGKVNQSDSARGELTNKGSSVSGSLVCASKGPVANESYPARNSRYMVEPCCYGVTLLLPTSVEKSLTRRKRLGSLGAQRSGTPVPNYRNGLKREILP